MVRSKAEAFRTSTRETTSADRIDIVERATCALAAIGLLVLAQVNFGVGVSASWRAQVSPFGFALAIGLAIAASVVRTPKRLRMIAIAILIVAAALTVFEAAAILLAQPGYMTDDGAFLQYATHLLLDGKNPYSHSLAPSLLAYGTPPVPTALTNGTISTSYVYPSLPVLLNVPFYWFSGGVQSVNIAAVFFQILAAGVLFAILPRQLRALAIVVVFEIPFLFGFEMAGSFYPMLLPFAIIAIWGWTAIGRTGRLSLGDFGKAAALGLACAIEQLVWLVAVFLVLGIVISRARELGRRRALLVTSRYVVIVLGSFVLVNFPFIIWSPIHWARDIIAPFTQSSIPYGEGLVDITLFLRVGGGDLNLYSYAALLLFAAAVVAFAVWFDSLWRALAVLAGIMFYVSTRPLDGYWLEVAPLWLASIAAVSPPLPRRNSVHLNMLGGWKGLMTSGVLIAPCLACIGLALSASAPLRLRIESASVEENLGDIWQVKLQATNLTAKAVNPHFALNSAGQLSEYWNIESGPRVLGARSSAVYELSSPNLATNPAVSTAFVMSAVMSKPDSVSTSPTYQEVDKAVWLNPSQVDGLVPVGQSVVFRAQLENSSTGSPIHQAGILIELTQLVLGEHGPIRGPALVSGRKPNLRFSIERTDAKGVATFRVRDTDLSGLLNHPIWFRAFIYSPKSFSYGSLNAVEVRWIDRH